VTLPVPRRRLRTVYPHRARIHVYFNPQEFSVPIQGFRAPVHGPQSHTSYAYPMQLQQLVTKPRQGPSPCILHAFPTRTRRPRYMISHRYGTARFPHYSFPSVSRSRFSPTTRRPINKTCSLRNARTHPRHLCVPPPLRGFQSSLAIAVRKRARTRDQSPPLLVNLFLSSVATWRSYRKLAEKGDNAENGRAKAARRRRLRAIFIFDHPVYPPKGGESRRVHREHVHSRGHVNGRCRW